MMRIDDPRDRIENFGRARLKREVRRGAAPAVVVAASMIVALLGTGLLVSKVAPTMLNSSYEMKFAVDDATAVVPKVNKVRFKGVPVGTIVDVGTEHDQAVLTVKMRKTYGRVYRDARAQLRPNTALNDMYLDIVDRGSARAGVLEGDTPLARSQTETPVSVSEVLDTFAPPVRLRLRTLLDDLGNGLDDRGRALRRIFVGLVPLVKSAGRITDQLAARGPLVRQLVHNASVLTRELGDREAQLRVLLRDGSATLSTLQAGSRDLDATLRELPPTVASVQASFARVRGTLDDIDGAVGSLYPVADKLPTALAAVRRLSGSASPAVRALRSPVAQLVPLARDLRPLSAELERTVTSLTPQVRAVDKVTKDLVLCRKGFQHFFQWNASMAKFGDARALAVPRGNVVVGAQSSSVLNDPYEFALKACSPGQAIAGRVPTEKDKH